MIHLINPITRHVSISPLFSKVFERLIKIILKDSKAMYHVVFEKHIALSMPYLNNHYNHGKKELDNGGTIYFNGSVIGI